MRVIVIGEKLENHLFEIVGSINNCGYECLFFKEIAKARFNSFDVLLIDCSLVHNLDEHLENRIISVITEPNYEKHFLNETVIDICSLKNTREIIEGPVSSCEMPVVADSSSINLFDIAARIARTDATVLISGETGTGKEVLAKYIHKMSDRSKQRFVAINCAAIPDTLVESELFGHEKGAFTNAHQRRIGKFEEANRGTILLDEISEMPLSLQAKLLRVIQEKEFSRLGGNEKIKVDVRIIATSNRNLEQAVREGAFREDLFYRLNIIPLEVPALRDRRMDIIPLAIYFCKKYSGSRKTLSKKLLNKLELREWKGNVRELENFIHRTVILSPKNIIDSEDLPFGIGQTKDYPANNEKTLAQIEKDAIFGALKKFGGNKKIVSEKLGIPARTLRHKLSVYKKEESDAEIINFENLELK